jgi:tetratricopeptide (TPR) repeat protein
MFWRLSAYIVAPKSTLRMPVLNGTFSRSENAIEWSRVHDLRIWTPTGEVQPDSSAWDARGDTTRLQYRPDTPGTYTVALSTKPRIIAHTAAAFNEYLATDGIPDVLQARRRAHALGRAVRERYAKHIKAVFQVGAANTDGWGVVGGYPAELVPLSNPYTLQVGDTLHLRALALGRAVAGQYVMVGGRAGSVGDARLPAFPTRSDADGVVRIPLNRPGRWFVKFIHMRAVDDGEADYESQWASLTFEVRRHASLDGVLRGRSPQVEAVSLLGRVLRGQAVTPLIDSLQQTRTAGGDAATRRIELGQAFDAAWRYTDGIAQYTAAIRAEPADARPLSYRGQRYITTRQFARARADLARAERLDSMSFDARYHRGLAEYFGGNFAAAERSWSGCVRLAQGRTSGQAMGHSPREERHCDDIYLGLHYALATWRFAALSRMGDTLAARRAVSYLPDSVPSLAEGRWYAEALRVLRGSRSPAVLDSLNPMGGPLQTMGYPVANLLMVRGDTAAGCALLRKLVAQAEWSSFGFIAAEVDLARGRCR